MVTSSSLMLMVPLPSLATTTTAFLQSLDRHTRAINQYAKRNLMLLEHNDAIDIQIDKVLIEKRKELLLDNIRNEQMVREVLLSSRLQGLHFLNRSEVRTSSIIGAGRGLFALEDISKGQLITCYPGDALLCKSKDGAEDILWGAHVPKADIWDEDAIFVGTEANPPLTSYSVSVDDQYSVLGHPSIDDNPAYYGHYANDGASMELVLDIEEELGVEENIATYVSKSIEVANAMHKPFREDAYHMVTIATRDIKAGEEILVTYGPDYWGIPAYFEEASFRNRVGQLLTTASLLLTFLSFWSLVQSLS